MTHVSLASGEEKLHRMQFAAALDDFMDVIRVESANALACQGAAQALFNLQRYQEAMQMSLRALDLNRTLVIPHTVLAYVYNEYGDKGKSRSEAQVALENEPRSVDALTCMGVLLVLGNELNEAKEYLEDAVAADPSNFLAQYNLGVVYQNTNDKRLMKQVLTLFRLRPTARSLLKVLYVSGRLHRLAYILILLLSAIVGFFTRPEIVLVVTGMELLLYIGTGLFIGFAMGQRQLKELRTNLRISGGLAIVGLVLYFLIRAGLLVAGLALTGAH